MKQDMHEYNPVLSDTELTVTDTARAKIADLITETQGEAESVRIYVSGSGCSGMNYGMTFADRIGDIDSVMQAEGNFKLVVDAFALGFLNGAEIDYVDDGLSASFVFNNVFQSVGGSGSCGGCGGGNF